MKKLIILLVLAALLMAGCGAEKTPQTETPTSAPTEAPTEAESVLAPDFTVLDSDGNELNLHSFFGKPVVLNFWASWFALAKMRCRILRKPTRPTVNRFISLW